MVEEEGKELGLVVVVIIDGRGGFGIAVLQVFLKVVVMQKGYGYFFEQESEGDAGRGFLDRFCGSFREKEIKFCVEKVEDYSNIFYCIFLFIFYIRYWILCRSCVFKFLFLFLQLIYCFLFLLVKVELEVVIIRVFLWEYL